MDIRFKTNDQARDEKNAALREISRGVFGDKATFLVVDPRELRLLKHNARYFKKETFRQLVDNVRADGMLSSVPLCHVIEEDALEVLSGNHRKKSAVEAKLPLVMVLVILERLETSKQIAIQLSHNALVGQDDAAILADLWGKIEDMRSKLYAGLSSDTLQELGKVKLTTFSTPQVYTKSLTFAFTAPEKEHLEEVLRDCDALMAADTLYLSHMAAFEEFFSAIKDVKRKEKIKNASLALLKMSELARQAMDQAGPGGE